VRFSAPSGCNNSSDLWRGLQPNPVVIRAIQNFFDFHHSAQRSWLRMKIKNPWHYMFRDWLRSVADSNRRKRFCRPLPSHSVNRPCTPHPLLRGEGVPLVWSAKIIKFALFGTISLLHPVYFHNPSPPPLPLNNKGRGAILFIFRNLTDSVSYDYL
jgi:hypothetical protein